MMKKIIPSIRTFILLSWLFFLTIRPAFSQEAATLPAEQQIEQYISSLLADIEQNNRIVGEITEESLKDLPIGVKKTIGGNNYLIAIDSARSTDPWYTNQRLCAYLPI